MGNKYSIYAFNYPYKGYYNKYKDTKQFMIALLYLTYYTIKYDGVNLEIRK